MGDYESGRSVLRQVVAVYGVDKAHGTAVYNPFSWAVSSSRSIENFLPGV